MSGKEFKIGETLFIMALVRRSGMNFGKVASQRSRNKSGSIYQSHQIQMKLNYKSLIFVRSMNKKRPYQNR